MKIKDKFYLISVIFVHYLVVLANVISFFAAPLVLPWYIAISIMSGIVSLLTNRNPCPLTTLENKIRERLGMPRIKGFIKHYVLNIKSTIKELLLTLWK
jgi:hypothetical protein